MFTGIVRKVSKIEKVSKKEESFFVSIRKPKGWKIKRGESISVNGICLTVRSASEASFEVEYMPETIRKTTVGNFRKGTLVNLEKSLKIGDSLDGHIVQGHVDTVGEIREIKKVGKSKVMKITVPKKFMKFIAEKGSIAIDGVSLTVVNIGKNRTAPYRHGVGFTVSLVSYTLENTNLGKSRRGDKVNVEVDILAKYIHRVTSKI